METDVLKIVKRFDGNAIRPVCDKRKFDRKPFTGLLAVAPFDGETIPADAKFTPVIGRDVSPSGVAFFIEEMPLFDHLVLRFGVAENAILLIARVVRSQQGFWFRKRQHLVGCQFETRVR